MIDTHCHLTYPQLADQLDGVLQRAEAVGVRRLISIGTRLADSQAALALTHRFSQIHSAAGIHPHHAGELSEGELEQLCAMMADPAVLAAGEMGLDYHYDFAPRADQQRVFETQLSAALAAHKPLVLHCREAIDPCLAILRNHGAIRGVFHCFTGTMDEARRILDAGFYLGFTGIITFKRSDELRQIVQMCPSDRLLLETDAPYLSPEPFRRQKINEPSLIVHTYRLVAQLRQLDLDRLDMITYRNAATLFGFDIGRTVL